MVTINSNIFPEQVPLKTRRDIIEALRWLNEAVAPSDDLLVTRMSNIYLTGVNDGITAAQKLANKMLSSIGRQS